MKKPVFSVTYNQTDISTWLSPFCLRVEYVDHLHEKSDGLEIKVEDAAGRWRGPWYPTKGDTLTHLMGYGGEVALPCGSFQIDEIEMSGPPDTVVLRALGAGIRKAVRTKNSQAYEGKTLAQVAALLAGQNGLTIIGTVPNLPFKRVTQHRETDLTFLRRLAREYGAVFSVRGSNITFQDLDTLEAMAPVLTMERSDFKGLSLKDKTHNVYGQVESKYWDPETKQMVVGQAAATGTDSRDTLRLRRRAESAAHSNRQAHAALKFHTGWQIGGTLQAEGNPLLCSGNNLQLGNSFGVFAGLYQITDSRHQMERDRGYATEIEVRRVR